MIVSASPYIWVSALFTLIVLSAMFGENPLFRAVESYFVGLSAALLAYFLVSDVLWIRVVEPLSNGSFEQLIPLIIAVIILLRRVHPFSEVSSYLVAVTVGISVSAALIHVFDAVVVRQLAYFVPAFREEGSLWFHAVILLSGILATATLFHFSPFRKTTLGWRLLDGIGVVSVIVAFGVFLGYTIASYAVLFVDRLYFLVHVLLGIV